MESLEAKGEANVKFFSSLSLALTTHSPTSSSSTAPISRSFQLLSLPCPVCLTVTSYCLPATGSVQCLYLQYSLTTKSSNFETRVHLLMKIWSTRCETANGTLARSFVAVAMCSSMTALRVSRVSRHSPSMTPRW